VPSQQLSVPSTTKVCSPEPTLTIVFSVESLPPSQRLSVVETNSTPSIWTAPPLPKSVGILNSNTLKPLLGNKTVYL
jgi:hypothetical protein